MNPRRRRLAKARRAAAKACEQTRKPFRRTGQTPRPRLPRLTRQEYLQGLADRGIDTWEDYYEEK